MSEKDSRTGGAPPPEDLPEKGTPRALLRFRRRLARGAYDRPEVAEAVARRLLARGDLISK